MCITIRKAELSDAPFIARVVLMALDDSAEPSENLISLCRRNDTLYSWNNSTLLEAENKPVGCVISYEGKEYRQMRERTWNWAWRPEYGDFSDMEAECFPGDYYVDSLAVLPDYRGKGFGRYLLEDARIKAYVCGCVRLSLLASVDKPRLQKYYEGFGFVECGRMLFFGHEFNRLCLSLNQVANDSDYA